MATANVASRPSRENEFMEAAPLLGSTQTRDNDEFDHINTERTSKANTLFTTIIYFMTIHFLLAFCEIILVAPLLRLFENSLCVSYYGFPEGGVPESMCKIVEIQRRLATIRGWKSTFDTIPVLLVAIPTGKLGDRFGRRKIMMLALIGVAVSLNEVFVVCAYPKIFPLQLVWLSSIILLCGGGLNSLSAFMWAMASESVPSERRGYAFYYIFSAFYIAELISSAVASLTIEISPWIACGLGFGAIILCLALLTFMPQPHKSNRDAVEAPSNTVVSLGPKQMSVDGLISALSSRNVLFTLPVFLVGIFRYTTLNFLIQYASIRFGLKISTGATFYTETAIVNIILFLFLIPQVTTYIRSKYGVNPQTIDLFLVRTSVSLMCVGCLAIGLAPAGAYLPIGVFIFASGFGSRVSALSLVSYWISENAKATLFAAIVVLESLGHAIGDPSMAQIFAASLKLEPFWTAMPFFFAGGLYFLATVSSRFIQLTDHAEEFSEPRLAD